MSDFLNSLIPRPSGSLEENDKIIDGFGPGALGGWNPWEIAKVRECQKKSHGITYYDYFIKNISKAVCEVENLSYEDVKPQVTKALEVHYSKIEKAKIKKSGNQEIRKSK